MPTTKEIQKVGDKLALWISGVQSLAFFVLAIWAGPVALVVGAIFGILFIIFLLEK
jgi:hypothetical protein